MFNPENSTIVKDTSTTKNNRTSKEIKELFTCKCGSQFAVPVFRNKNLIKCLNCREYL